MERLIQIKSCNLEENYRKAFYLACLGRCGHGKSSKDPQKYSAAAMGSDYIPPEIVLIIIKSMF